MFIEAQDKEAGSTAEELIMVPCTGLRTGDVLQIFDVLRRRIARAHTGSEGMFPGYDKLELNALSDVRDATLECSAQVTWTSRGLQHLSYRAVIHRPSVEQVDVPAQVVAVGYGRTIGLQTPVLQHRTSHTSQA
jgi:hypothetical protein